MIELLHIDCMNYMATCKDKRFDLAIVDPPYGIGENGNRGNVSTKKWKNPGPSIHKKKEWDNEKPTEKYFNELFRISKNQIIWGGNYFTEYLPSSMGWVFWDKQTGDSDYSDGELAFTSFNKALKKFEWLWSGFKQQQIEKRLHPTQKPVQLYKWLLKNYAKPDFKIIDTHLGSGSSAIAAYDFGITQFVGCEIDLDYYDAAIKRFENHKLQQTINFG